MLVLLLIMQPVCKWVLILYILLNSFALKTEAPVILYFADYKRIKSNKNVKQKRVGIYLFKDTSTYKYC
jgi:hypothetical protein